MAFALWIVGLAAAIVFLAAGAVKLVARKSWMTSHGMAWAERMPRLVVALIGLIEVVGAAAIVLGLIGGVAGFAPLAWWLVAAAGAVLAVTMVGALALHLRRRENPVAPVVPGILAVATVVIAALLASQWPGGVGAPTMAVPQNPLWSATTKPDPVPAENVVLSLPQDMYRHKDAPTEWWWHVGTLRAGDRVFGFEINAASFVGQGFAMSQVMLADVSSQQHYERTQVYVPRPAGPFDVSTWAEGDPGKGWYARLGDPGWAVGGITVTDGGSGYTKAPTVTFSGGGGSGASAVAQLDSNGAVSQIYLIDPGSGYTETPTISLDGGDGSGAAAVAVRSFVSMTAPQQDPSQDIHVQAHLVDDSPGLTAVDFDLTFSQRGRPFYVFGTGIEPSATIQSLKDANYYYSYTQLAASGTITIDGEPFEVSGTTWMDHEYGYFGGGDASNRVRWLLQDLQLDNGYSVSNAGLIGEGYRPEIGVTVDSYATVQDAQGALYYVASRITPVGELWVSPRTGIGYAQQFLVEIPSMDARFTVTTRVQDQEFAVAGAPIYEGTSGVSGTIGDTTVTGDAWIEQAF